MADVFISFKTTDTARVAQVRDAFRARGLSVFWSNDIAPGEPNYQLLIKDEMQRAVVVVVVWTNDSVHSHPVAQECAQAERWGKLLQAQIDDIEPIDFPMEAKFKAQKAMLIGWAGDTAHPEWARLAVAVENRLAPERRGEIEAARRALAASSPPPAPKPEQKPSVSVSGNVFTQPTATVNQAPLRKRIEDYPGIPSDFSDVVDTLHGRTFEVRVGDGKNDKVVRLAPGESIKDAPFAPEMVLVPPGKFWMGSRDGEGHDKERPRHEVTIGGPLLVGKYPVTFDEWDAYVSKASIGGFLGLGGGKPHQPSDQGWGRGVRPVVNVSWDDAKVFAEWLSRASGKSYRLLSEAEWEYACRAGTDTAYSFGDSLSKQQAHFSQAHLGSAKRAVDVGLFPANAFGLHDMHGNVSEWCEDPWRDNYRGARVDGSSRHHRDETDLRVLRGGSWYLPAGSLRSANRYRRRRDEREPASGFRLARTLGPTP